MKGPFLVTQQACLGGRQGEEARRWPRAGRASLAAEGGSEAPNSRGTHERGPVRSKCRLVHFSLHCPKRSSINGFRAGPENGQSKLQAMSEDTKPFPLKLVIRGLQLKLQD